MAGDGQVSLGNTVIKGNARKVRRIGNGQVLAGFAGATADAFTLLERLEAKLERFPGQLERACVELAKDWRTDRYLRRLEAMMAVADAVALLHPHRPGRRAGTGGRSDRHRLGRQLCPRRRARPDDGGRPGRRGGGAPGHADRGRDLRVHQPFRDR